MRPSCWLSPLAWTASSALALGLAMCRVDAPALECVRNSQCPVGQHCSHGQCMAGTGSDSGGDAPADAADDSADEVAADSAEDQPDVNGPDAPEEADAVQDGPVDEADDTDGVDAPVDAADAPEDTPPDLPSLDPAPEFSNPGEYRCDEAPDADLDASEPDTYQFLRIDPIDYFDISGTVTGTTQNGVWYVRQPSGGQAIGTFVTNGDGSFRAVVPTDCSEVASNVVKLVWRSEPCDLVLVFDVQTPLCQRDDLHVGLWWNLEGDDLDLHLVREEGMLNNGDDDCNNSNCIGLDVPDWGAIGPQGDPRKDFDSGSGGGPENIIIEAGASGIYTIVVERWGTAEDAPQDAIIIASMDGRPRVTMTTALRPRHVWLAAEVNYDEGRWMPLSEVIDCSAAWNESVGCMLSLP